MSSRLILNPGELVRQRPAGIPQCASIVVTLWLSLLSLGSAAMAQKTVVVDAAGGMKEELVYDSSGRVVETRTLDANGKVQVRSIFDFPSGFYAERRHTTTSYGPDGRSVQSASTEDYDENANFTQEVIALYDSTGKQTGGHKLTHDPMTGIYRCWNWDGARQSYQAIQCPAGEEESEPDAVKPLTLEQATRQLAAAQSVGAGEKPAHAQRQTRGKPSASEAGAEVGLILPAQLIAGERVSGSIVSNPAQYQGVPDLTVVRMVLPSEAARSTSPNDWTVEVPGAAPQPANGPVTFTVPTHTQEFDIVLRRTGNPSQMVSQNVKVSGRPTKGKMETSPTYRSAALCVKNDVCNITGTFTGDSGEAFAAFGDVPAPILAETRHTLYIGVPEQALGGPQYLLVKVGTKLLGFPIAVAGLTQRTSHWNLKKGGTSLLILSVSGPGDLSDEQWHAGAFPASNLARARALVPAFRLIHEGRKEYETRDAHEKKPGHDEKEGVVLVVVQNATPELASFQGSKNGTFTFELTPDSFKSAEFVYKFVVRAAQDGRFVVKATIIPFLAPVAGQEFPLEQSAAISLVH